MTSKTKETIPDFMTGDPMRPEDAQELLIGTVEIDSGHVSIVDPCNADAAGLDKLLGLDLNARAMNGDVAYSDVTGSKFTIASTGYGDGRYPVWALVLPNGRVASIQIDFINLETGDPRWIGDDVPEPANETVAGQT